MHIWTKKLNKTIPGTGAKHLELGMSRILTLSAEMI